MDEIRFKIGEMAKLNHVTQHTLRHYDQLGLLKPTYVDEHSGYRYYTVDDCDQLNRIRAYKAIGFSLDKIGKLLGGELIMFKEGLIQLSGELDVERQRIEMLKSYIDDQLSAISALDDDTLINEPEVMNFEDRYGHIIHVNASMEGVEIIKAVNDFESCHKGHGEVYYKPMRLSRIIEGEIRLVSYYAGIRGGKSYDSDQYKVEGGRFLVMDKKNNRLDNHKFYKRMFDYGKNHGLQFEGTVLELLSIPQYITGNYKDTTVQIQMKLGKKITVSF